MEESKTRTFTNFRTDSNMVTQVYMDANSLALSASYVVAVILNSLTPELHKSEAGSINRVVYWYHCLSEQPEFPLLQPYKDVSARRKKREKMSP